ncbi:hypothetical protein HNR16_000454 [Pseudoclavibacter chungangensis]|nr:hypothetical protein [Pseudoclavibacter chungangensis]
MFSIVAVADTNQLRSGSPVENTSGRPKSGERSARRCHSVHDPPGSSVTGAGVVVAVGGRLGDRPVRDEHEVVLAERDRLVLAVDGDEQVGRGLRVARDVDLDVTHRGPVPEVDAVVVQVGEQWLHHRLVLVVAVELECREVGQPVDVMDEAHEVAAHLDEGMPLLEREHRRPVDPEVALEEVGREVVGDRLVAEALFRGEDELHDLLLCLVREGEVAVGGNALALLVDQAAVRGVRVVLVEPVVLVEVRGALDLERGDRPVHVPEALEVVLHLASAARDEADVGPVDSVERAAREGELLEDVDAFAGYVAVPDEEHRGGEAGETGPDDPRRRRLGALRRAGPRECFVVSVRVVHDLLFRSTETPGAAHTAPERRSKGPVVLAACDRPIGGPLRGRRVRCGRHPAGAHGRAPHLGLRGRGVTIVILPSGRQPWTPPGAACASPDAVSP